MGTEHGPGPGHSSRAEPGPSARRRLPGWKSFQWRTDLALPATLAAFQTALALAISVWHAHHSGSFGALGWAMCLVGPVALVARRRHPAAVLWVTLAATLTPAQAWPAYLSLVAAFLTAAAGGHRRAAWSAVGAGFVGSTWLVPLAYGRAVGSAQAALLLAAWLAVLVVVGEVLRLRQERAAQARTARQLDARRRASDERLRMARDLHDVIGHNISLINVQAGVGLELMDGDAEQARAALAAIKDASKEALGELRAMLSTLRQGSEEVPLSPTPGLDRLPELVRQTEAAGLSVLTEVAGPARPLPAPVEVAAYRVVQESLTNVARHAGPVTVRVRLEYGENDLLVEVVDNGGPRPDARDEPGAGTGIAGMRERVTAIGGQLAAGPRPGGGFAVSACIPLGGRP